MNRSMVRSVGVLACVVLVTACCRNNEKEKRAPAPIESASAAAQPAATQEEAKARLAALEVKLEKLTNDGADAKFRDEYTQCIKDFERALTAYYDKKYDFVMYLAPECESKIDTLAWMANNPGREVKTR